MESGAEFDINSETFAKLSYENVYLSRRNKDSSFSYKVNGNFIIENKYWKISVKTTASKMKKNSNNIAVFANKVGIYFTDLTFSAAWSTAGKQPLMSFVCLVFWMIKSFTIAINNKIYILFPKPCTVK